VAALAVLLFWIGSDCQWGRLYSAFPYHRWQVGAILEGHLSLSSSIDRTEHGLAWYDGRANQVWGLGVALWMIPFELAWRLFGASPCPDRVPLLAAVALFAWYTSRAGLAVAKVLRSKTAGFSFFYLLLLFPPVWNLILGRQSIFEETILYACLVSLTLLVALIRFLLFRKRIDFWIVCALAGLSGLIRVTHGVYGAIACFLCVIVMWRSAIRSGTRAGKNFDWSKLRDLILGVSMFLTGIVLLGWSNSVRFGALMECGHRLTNHTADVVYLTRFGNPFRDASLLDAIKELVSWIFLSPFHQFGSDWNDLLPWQASAIRWRGVSQATFDPSFLLVSIVGSSAATYLLFRRVRQRGWNFFLRRHPVHCALAGLLIWFFLSFFVLSSFYLYSPILATRYILDFSAALAAPCILLFVLSARRWPRLVSMVVLVWLCCEGTGLWTRRGDNPGSLALSRANLSLPSVPEGRDLTAFQGKYSLEKHPLDTKVPYNGAGWSSDGIASAIVTIAVDNPQFLEIVVGQPESPGEIADVYRAKVGNMELPVEHRMQTFVGNRAAVKVRFRIPDQITRQQCDQLMFLCFRTNWELQDRRSTRPLYEIRWRE